MKLIDIGVNLTDHMFKGIYNGKQSHPDDLCLVLKRAWDNGIHRMIITSGSLQECEAAFSLSKLDERLYCTVGCHPTRTLEWHQFSKGPNEYFNQMYTFLKDNYKSKKIVAIGELGLDYDRLCFSDAEYQRMYFIKQFELASAFDLPLFLHCRNAYKDFIDIVTLNKSQFKKSGVVHSFTGTKEEAEIILNIGFYIGLNGCSFKTEENIHVIESIPLNRVLIETDAPWCEIRPTHAGFKYLDHSVLPPYIKYPKEKFVLGQCVKSRNEPCYLINVLSALAKIKNIPEKDLEEIIYENTTQLFFSSS